MAPGEPKISAVLIVKNSEAHLRECLASVAWCDEIVVLDGGSTDASPAICAEFKARVDVERDWQGFGVQKNRALSRARGEWVFSIDADEVCPPGLRDELKRAAASAQHAAYEMPRRSSFCGHFMRHGGWWPDYVTRLFRRDKAKFSDSRVHERLIVDGTTGRLATPLTHYSYDDMRQALEKMERYSTLGAQQAFEAGKRSNPVEAALRAAWTFVRTYVVRLGFLDGAPGFALAKYNAQTTYLRYLKLSRLGREGVRGEG